MHVRFAWQAHEHEILHTVVREEYIQCVCLAGHLEEMHGLSLGIISIVVILLRLHPCMNVCMHVCMHVCMCMYECMQIIWSDKTSALGVCMYI